MNNRPTPDTDALITLRSGFGVTDYEWRQHSRKLERQRDAAISRFESSQSARMELKRERDELQRAVQNHRGAINIVIESLDRAITQRDEARELALELRDKLRALADECLLPGFNQEWDTFVEAESALIKAKEVLP